MAEVFVFLADGFEEIEGLTVVDILRRAGIDTQTVSVTGNKTIAGSHGIEVQADILFEEMTGSEAEMYVLPGGQPGTAHLAAHEGLARLLKEKNAAGKKIAAICAAPTVLGGLGLLEGKTAVCYPGLEEKLTGAKTTENQVEVCGSVTTSRGMGTAIPFSLALVAELRDRKTADEVGRSIVYAS